MDIRYTLTTSDGCGGSGFIGKPDSFAWGHDLKGEGETIFARFEQVEDDGTISETREIDGNDWRALEDSGETEMVLTWVRRGCVLESAVDAAIQECDPDGFDGYYENRIDDLIGERVKLRKALQELIHGAEAMDARLLALTGSSKESERGDIARARQALIDCGYVLEEAPSSPTPAGQMAEATERS